MYASSEQSKYLSDLSKSVENTTHWQKLHSIIQCALKCVHFKPVTNHNYHYNFLKRIIFNELIFEQTSKYFHLHL